jgi:hypothetical protein
MTQLKTLKRVICMFAFAAALGLAACTGVPVTTDVPMSAGAGQTGGASELPGTLLTLADQGHEMEVHAALRRIGSLPTICAEGVVPDNPTLASRLGLSEDTLAHVKRVRGLDNALICSLSTRRLQAAVSRALLAPFDHVAEAEAFRELQRRNENGVVDPTGFSTALQQRTQMTRSAAASGPPPLAGVTSGQWVALGPGNIGGRVRSLIVNPSNSNQIWVGSVAGGIWTTSNGGASWAPVSDYLANTAISGLVIDPSNPQMMYASTGERMSGDGLRGLGVFSSSDGGANWFQIPSTNPIANADWYYVNRIAVHPTNGQILIAATENGAYRSADGGGTWTKLFSGIAVDVKFDPSNGSTAVVSGYNGNVWYSTDSGTSWRNIVLGTPSASFHASRVELSFAKAKPGLVFASVDINSGSIYRSNDGGATWALLSSPAHLGSQGGYANAMAVSPDGNMVVVGGLDLYLSTNGGTSFNKISSWGYSPKSAHADHHAIVMDPNFDGVKNKQVFFGNDGGIYTAKDVTLAQPDPAGTGWTNLNNGLSITQFYSGAGYTGGALTGGTQDNGTLIYNGSGINWSTYFGGDGGYTGVDGSNPTTLYGEYVLLSIFRSTLNSNGTRQSPHICTGLTDGYSDPTFGCPGGTSKANFIAPFLLDPNSNTRILAGGASLWVSNNTTAASPTWSAIKAPSAVANNFISAIAVSKTNPNLIWVGHNNGELYYTVNGTSAAPIWTTVTGIPKRMVTRIVIDPVTQGTVYVSLGGYFDYSAGNLQRTTDNGLTWTDASTGLPKAPIRALARFPGNTNWLYAGTEVGLFSSENGGASWSAVPDGPGNQSVDDLFWMDNSTLVALTHGRGAFMATINSSATACTYSLEGAASAFPSTAASGNINVSASLASCGWTASNNAAWITITSASSGTGDALVSFALAANNTGATRSGTITVAGQTFSVSQYAQSGCNFSLNPPSVTLVSSAGVGNVTVSAASGCAWTAVSSASWLTVTAGASGSGAGSVTYSAAANTSSSPRSATLTIGGQVFSVTQAAANCSFSLDATSATVAATAGSGSINVSAVSGCAWTAQSGATWITITSGATGSGSGSVSYTFAANPSSSARTGTITVAGITYNVTQGGSTTCNTFTLDSSSAALPSAGGQVLVNVNAGATCTWTATTASSWISISAGSSLTGSGAVVATVAPNPYTTTRAGVINIAGQTFSVVVDAVNSQETTTANDTFTGSTAPINTAVYTGMSGEYTVSVGTTGVVTVADSVSGRDGADTLNNIQRAQFADNFNLAFDLNGSAGAGGIYRLYAAAFNRVPDLQGIGYWILQSDLGQSMTQIATGFTYSTEFATLYGTTISDNYATGANLTNLVTGFYTNVLHRAPDPGGLNYYVGQIASHGKSVGQVLAEISDSAENRTQVAPQIQNGVLFWPWRPDSTTYPVGGTVTGLNQSGLVLLVNGNPNPVPAGASSFSQAGAFVYGTRYNVTVKSQPTGQTCTVSNATGLVGSAAVTSVVVNCGLGYSLSGSVSGLTTPSLILASNGQTLAVPGTSTSFNFPSLLAAGAAYNVVVQTQPTGQLCSVSNGSGTIAAASVSNVAVTCTSASQPLQLTISGLKTSLPAYLYNGTQLVETLSLTPGQTTANFTTLVSPAAISAYRVSIGAQYQGATGYTFSSSQYCKPPQSAGSLVGNTKPLAAASGQGYVYPFNCSDTYTLQFNLSGVSAGGTVNFGFCDTGCWSRSSGNGTWNMQAAIDSPSGWTLKLNPSSSGQTCTGLPVSGPVLAAGSVQQVTLNCP